MQPNETVEYKMAVLVTTDRHEGCATALTLADETLVLLGRSATFDLSEVDDVGLSGIAAALEMLVDSVRPLPDDLTIYTNEAASILDVLPLLSDPVREALDETSMRVSRGMDSAMVDFLNTFDSMASPRMRTRFHDNPRVYRGPLQLVTDASVRFNPEGEAVWSMIGWYVLDANSGILAMGTCHIEETDSTDAERRAAEEALAIASDFNASHVQVLTDSEAASIQLRDEVDAARSDGPTAGFERVDVVRLTRSQNCLADALVDLGLRFEFTGHAHAVPRHALPDDKRLCGGFTSTTQFCHNPVSGRKKTCYLHSDIRDYW